MLAELAAQSFELVGDEPGLTLGARIAKSGSRFTYGERLNIAPSGKRFRSNFIEPGLVSYTDVGGDVELLRKETIEAALNTALGNPLTVGHVSTRLNARDLARLSRGAIDKVGYDAGSGWFFCEGTVDDDHARERIRRNERPSCGYRVLSFGPAGVHHNIPYAREITGIEFHHLAIVNGPRYEGSDFRLNAKTQNSPTMKNPFKILWKALKPAAEAGGAQTEVEESREVAADSTIEVDGKPVRLNELVEAHQANAAAEAAAKKTAPAPEARDNELSPDSVVELPGEAGQPGAKVPLSELVASYQARANAGRETAEQKTARESRERENAVRAAADQRAAEARASGTSHFRVLAAARSAPLQVSTERCNSANTIGEQIARGADRYGSPSKN